MIKEAINGEIVSDRHQISEECSGDPGSEIRRLDSETKAYDQKSENGFLRVVPALWVVGKGSSSQIICYSLLLVEFY